MPPIVAVPIADASSWRVSLGVWCLLAVVAAAPWIWQLVVRGRHVENLDTEARGIEAAHAGIGTRLFRSKIAWSMALLFAMPTISVYAMFAWLPSLAVEISGVDAAQAGALLGAFAICGVPAALIVPILAVRLRSVRPLIIAGAHLLRRRLRRFPLRPDGRAVGLERASSASARWCSPSRSR